MARGKNQNIVRWLSIGKDEAEYNEKLRKYEVDIYKNFYSCFFPQFASDPNADWLENIKKSGIYTCGTIAQVREEWKKMYEEVPAEYITLIFHYAQQPKDDVIKTIEQFMTQVWPHLESAE